MAPDPTYFEKQRPLSIQGYREVATAWRRGQLFVLRSLATMTNGANYIHCSVSRKDRHPTWEEMVLVRDQFIGRDTEAVLVLPPKVFHVNVHEHCFHWWSLVGLGNGTELPGLHKIRNEVAL